MNMIMPRGQGLSGLYQGEDMRAGTLSVRLAAGAREVDAAQALRFDVFYREMGAQADGPMMASGRDHDAFDAVADHLVVIDDAAADLPCGIVATYRLIGGAAAAQAGGFYSASEFDISALTATARNALELGRSCVHPRYRGGRAMQLMWRGLAAYVHAREIDVMFGCASFPGTDPDAIADQLSYLAQTHLAPVALRPRALPDRFVDMRRRTVPAGAYARIAAGLPPLIKGYLRLGGWVGDGAVIDAAFNTIDVAIVVQTELVTRRYLRHYERDLADTPS